jgi:two-component system response regulator FixJ
VIHIIDDDAALRDSLAILFQAHNMASLQYENGEKFLSCLPAIKSGCALIDVNMPGLSGLEVLSTVMASPHPIPCIVMTGLGEVSVAVKAMKAGALDFIEKPCDGDMLIESIHHAMAALPQAAFDGHAAEKLARLTPREHDVMQGVARGKQNKVIAQELGISPRTVEIHRARLMTKLEAGSAADIVRFALALPGNSASHK